MIEPDIVHSLKLKFSDFFTRISAKSNLINSQVKPTNENLFLELNKQNKMEAELEKEIKNAPDFWLIVFKKCKKVSRLIQEDDVPILKSLTDVKIKEDFEGFVIEFHFAPNQYFTNPVLTKRYIMKYCARANDPFPNPDPIIIGCRGCHIDWKWGKNVVTTTIKERHWLCDFTRMRTIKNKSFFNFFSPPMAMPDASEYLMTPVHLRSDFELGYLFYAYTIPHAVHYFLDEIKELGLQNYEDFFMNSTEGNKMEVDSKSNHSLEEYDKLHGSESKHGDRRRIRQRIRVKPVL